MLSAGTQRVAIEALIKLLVVVGSYIFIGNSGVLSFGHVSFMADRRLRGGLAGDSPETKELMLPSLPALLMDAHYSPDGWRARGRRRRLGIRFVGRAPAGTIERHLGEHRQLCRACRGQCRAVELDLDDRRAGLALWAAVLCQHLDDAAVGACRAGARLDYQQSRFGLRLRGARDDEVAAPNRVGVNIWRERLIAFVVSAFFAAWPARSTGIFSASSSRGLFTCR